MSTPPAGPPRVRVRSRPGSSRRVVEWRRPAGRCPRMRTRPRPWRRAAGGAGARRETTSPPAPRPAALAAHQATTHCMTACAMSHDVARRAGEQVCAAFRLRAPDRIRSACVLCDLVLHGRRSSAVPRLGAAEPAAALMSCPGRSHQQPVGSAYQPPASSIFLSEQISHQQSASSTFLSEQISTSHQPNEQAAVLHVRCTCVLFLCRRRTAHIMIMIVAA
jgi:hypothetical protein